MDLPAVNAILNSTSTLLLVAGYVFIRKRKIAAHQFCMLVALGVSVAFLESYLYYHFAVMKGLATEFKGQGWVRPVYYTILISHIVLAPIAAALAVYVAYLGLSGNLPRHVRLARWTLPIWLYVSVTGVVVYWMLYQLYPAG